MSVRKALEAGYIVEAMTAYYRMRRLRVDPDELHDLAEIAITALDEIREQQKALAE
jgi:hypothetical protein